MDVFLMGWNFAAEDYWQWKAKRIWHLSNI